MGMKTTLKKTALSEQSEVVKALRMEVVYWNPGHLPPFSEKMPPLT